MDVVTQLLKYTLVTNYILTLLRNFSEEKFNPDLNHASGKDSKNALETFEEQNRMNSFGRDSLSEDSEIMDYLRGAKRGGCDDMNSYANVNGQTNWRKALCGKYDDWCLSNANKPGLTCCEEYTCKCNLWNTNCRRRGRLSGPVKKLIRTKWNEPDAWRKEKSMILNPLTDKQPSDS
ncbi:hypothetical protein CAPTEDRAFT_221134 [Capitella teleta]|uniref:Uncharacterized protein n=1 Tax=Capitella teleta TaxID=283909 RepID=R7V0S7_CAPTE|nr:hypothetical protein CAPTEDRAFT_221134 [Capitella teleta]|eukprot:ELU09291.1 hypothetical protein CAPTEDRAFT_221134 [Capitella teleta]